MKRFQVGKFALGWLVFEAAMKLHAQSNPGVGLKLAPAYPEIMPTYWELHQAAIVGCIIVLILLLVPVIWMWLKPKPVAVVPPEAAARGELMELSGRAEDGACLSRVSQVVRHYFIAAFGIPAGEPTTAEFSALLVGNQKISAELKTDVTDFLRRCDERKFGTVPGAEPVNAVPRALELIGQAEKTRQTDGTTTS